MVKKKNLLSNIHIYIKKDCQLSKLAVKVIKLYFCFQEVFNTISLKIFTERRGCLWAATKKDIAP